MASRGGHRVYGSGESSIHQDTGKLAEHVVESALIRNGIDPFEGSIPFIETPAGRRAKEKVQDKLLQNRAILEGIYEAVDGEIDKTMEDLSNARLNQSVPKNEMDETLHTVSFSNRHRVRVFGVSFPFTWRNLLILLSGVAGILVILAIVFASLDYFFPGSPRELMCNFMYGLSDKSPGGDSICVRIIGI